MKNYANFKKQLLKGGLIRKAYQEYDMEFKLIQTLIKQRLDKGFTQKELAKAIGTQQSAIARFESGTYNPTLAFIRKISTALELKLKIYCR